MSAPRKWVWASLALLLGLVLAGTAAAGIGGGHGYGGGGGGGGGDGDGIGYLVYMLVRLTFHYPAVGIPLLIVVAVVFVAHKKQTRGSRNRLRQTRLTARSRVDLEALREVDANFSEPLFRDFVRLLYVRVQEAHGAGRTDALRPYLAADATLPPGGDVTEVSDVVVGSMQVLEVRASLPRHQVTLLVEACVTETKGEESRRLLVKDRLRLGRRHGVLSQGPERLRQLGCPSCGSRAECSAEGRCSHCQEVVTDGRFHWQVETLERLRRQTLAEAESLTYHAPPVTVAPPTVMDPELDARRRELTASDPEFSWSVFQQHVRHVFVELNAAWTSKEWARARPYETDSLFDRHRFWMDRYQEKGVTNVVKDIQIPRVEVVRIQQDAYLDSVTVRVHAKMLDFTIRDADGKVLGGSDRTPRTFSEYWTFVRRTGARRKEGAEEGACPSCAAPLQINQAGTCDFCGAHVTSGEFDWVLAAIDQEQSYRG